MTTELGQKTMEQAELFVAGAIADKKIGGGWAFYTEYNGRSAQQWGHTNGQTASHRMVLLGLIKGLDFFEEPTDITVHLKSDELFEAMSTSPYAWRAEGETENDESLWLRFSQIMEIHNVQFINKAAADSNSCSSYERAQKAAVFANDVRLAGHIVFGSLNASA